MGWFDSGHTDPAPRGQTVDIPNVSKVRAVTRFGITVGADRPIGKITTDPNDFRDI